MAPALSILVPFTLSILIATSKAVQLGYFCSSSAGNGSSGTFSVYDTSNSQYIGCLDKHFRWVVDGSCAVYTMTGTTSFTFSTIAGECSIYRDPSTSGYVYYCGLPPSQDPLTFNCDMTRYEGHYAFTQRAMQVPIGSEKVNITFEQSVSAPGFAIELSGNII